MKALFQISPNEAPAVTQHDKSRWLVLLLLFMTTFGSLFAYDTIGVLQETLEETLDIDQFKLDLLYDVAIIPNIVLPILSGLIIDRFGIRPTFVIFSFLIVIGQLVVYLGVNNSSFYIILLGRFVFGLGYQSQYVAKSVLVTRWANTTELSFALSLSAFLSRLGTSFNSIASPTIYKDFGLPAPFMTGLILVSVQILLVFVIIYVDKKSNVAVDEYRNYDDMVTIRDVFSFSRPFYILSVGCALSAGIFYTFFENGTGLLTQRFGMSEDQAEEVLNIIFAVSTFGLPLFGIIADKVPNKLHIMPIFVTFFIIAAMHLALKEIAPITNPDYSVLINLVFFGLFYASFNAILWSCIPSVTILTKVGIASGLTISLVEIVIFLLPILSDGLYDATYSTGYEYFATTIMYAIAGLIVLGLVIWLIREDKALDYLLSGKGAKPPASPVKKVQVLEMKMDEKFMKFENDRSLSEEL